jgi:hypothetical protein
VALLDSRVTLRPILLQVTSLITMRDESGWLGEVASTPTVSCTDGAGMRRSPMTRRRFSSILRLRSSRASLQRIAAVLATR